MSRIRLLLFACGTLAFGGVAQAQLLDLEVVTYNIEADIDGYKTPRPGLDTVLEGINEQPMNGTAQMFDILALQETTSNAMTVSPIVSDLNSYYGSNIYAMATYQASHGSGTGNGPSALIYNTTELSLLGTSAVAGTGNNTSGAARVVIRYEFQPVGGTAANDFYVYVSHMKSDATSSTVSNPDRRNNEAQAIRADAATLPANSSIIYVGDFNIDGSSEAAYQTLTAAGTGKAVDPLNISQNANINFGSSANKAMMTESATNLRYRDDIQFMTQNVYDGSKEGGLSYIDGTYSVFGNNGTVAYKGTVDTAANTSLDNLVGPISSDDVLAALTTASDHLPVLAGYSIDMVPEPGTLALFAAGLALLAGGLLRRRQSAGSAG